MKAPPECAAELNSLSRFPLAPASWFHFSASHKLDRTPLPVCLGGREFVGFRTASGKPVVLSGRCVHLQARLGNGTVRGERLICPLHGWEYGVDGKCEKIPATNDIPKFARQISYPVEERGGHVFFFNRPQARFPFPFFDGVSPHELLAAKPFELLAEAPWYFIGANGFDIQHFRMAHDRTLLGPPTVSNPSPFARRLVAAFEVSGKSVPDQLTRVIAGPRVEMDITVWCGSLILVRATFARTTTFGMFNVLPLDAENALGRVMVWVKRRKNFLGRTFFDPINAAVRRLFIRTFLKSDLPRISGLRYQPQNLIAEDRVLRDYFDWLENVSEISPLEKNS